MSADPQSSHVNLDNPVEIVISRVFAASREQVWQAWTDSKHAERWWGPAGFSTTTLSQDFRPGGSWRYTMHGPDGQTYPNRIDYIEIVHPSRLVYKLGGDEGGDESVRFHVEVLLETLGEKSEKTQVTMRSVFPSAQARDFVINNYNAAEGGKQHLANLEDYLVAMSATDGPVRAFTISHHFGVPRERLWQAWTQREHLIRWFGPKGSDITQATLDLRQGGLFHYCMNHPNGTEMWGRWQFREIDPPHKLHFVSSFSNPQSEICPAPFPGFDQYPLEVMTTVTFVDHAGLSKGTLVTVESQPFNATKAQHEFFQSIHSAMHQGWTGTMERLVEFLKTLPSQSV